MRESKAIETKTREQHGTAQRGGTRRAPNIPMSIRIAVVVWNPNFGLQG